MLYIVSGLPRSGTSMAMKMLQAGGMDILTDNVRQADRDNPLGYFEYEPIKNLGQESSWLEGTRNRVLKVISHLLPKLPEDNTYKVLFLLRPLDEVLASQRAMLERQGQPFQEGTEASLKAKFKDHLYTTRLWLVKQAHMECLFLDYPDVIQHPLRAAERIKHFFQLDCCPTTMASAVDSTLYRNRSES